MDIAYTLPAFVRKMQWTKDELKKAERTSEIYLPTSDELEGGNGRRGKENTI